MNQNGKSPFTKFNLDGKTALITGGAGSLGKEHARALLEAGASVVLWDISKPALESTRLQLEKEYRKRDISTAIVDISEEKDVTAAAEILRLNGVNIDILINNAAVNPKYNSAESPNQFSRIEDFQLKDWNLELKVGLTGSFICSKIIGSQMASRKNGVIVNIASDLSVIAPNQAIYRVKGLPENQQPVKPVTYSVVKSGLIGLTRYLATYWKDSGIRVNALSPGGVYENQSIEFQNRISELIPLGRMAKLDEYRSAIQFLCSDASSYMTGQNIVIDGGRSVW
jgi:NAD(P)-dependent dehydrogenase (short-subunit alcohol dehydrogenase family)